MPQVLATFLASGEFINFWKLGFFKYRQRQGLCSLSLLQHIDEGGVDDDVMALVHGLSSSGLQSPAIDTWV